ncbi:phosphoribosyltransferase family protein [Lysinibacillus fusiformis]|uniref:phosphoribosyltransferase family protein n=1 Tax=Lysinibacillus fusiformis TaxID=28031 RepID=UPI001882F585|nr:phosphoribosyltransferase family protein [Lysinibacillus fusiformis]MBD8522896.1 phosphoribosyltransferase family protein [Lysinibacillus fusiformis]
MQQQMSKLTILPNYSIDIEITHNPHNFALTDLFQMAARINKKRQFLFVSTVLGKHLAVRPQIPLLTGALLAMMYDKQGSSQKVNTISSVVQALKEGINIEELQNSVKGSIELAQETLFIGFAETATALGHAVFNAFQSNAMYIHTTREVIPYIEPFVTFEEEHSHATSHRIYTEEPDVLQQAKRIVLIDDEITTGNTVINIIETLKKKFPDVKQYVVLSILDWRSDQQRIVFQQLEEQWGISIEFISIMCGSFNCTGVPSLPSIQPNITTIAVSDINLLPNKGSTDRLFYHSIAENGKMNSQPYLKATGRFMLTSKQHFEQNHMLQAIAKQLKELRTDGPALVIGTGEFMYVPMQIASYLGNDVYFQSTTRSPIYCTDDLNYTITEKIVFESPENNGVENYLYNVQSQPYTELFLLVERIASNEVVARMVAALQSISEAKVYVICMHELEGAR